MTWAIMRTSALFAAAFLSPFPTIFLDTDLPTRSKYLKSSMYIHVLWGTRSEFCLNEVA